MNRAAFTAIVNSLVTDILMPPLGLLLGGIDFSSFFITLKGTGGYPTLDTVRKMNDHFDLSCPADRKLVPSGSDHDSVEADWTQFNAALGGSTA